MSLNQIEAIAPRVRQLGYSIRQSPSASNCWYLSKQEFNYLFALKFENNSWQVNDISGRGANEQPRIEREVAEACQ